MLHTFLLMGIGYVFLEKLQQHSPLAILILLGLLLAADIALFSRYCLGLFNEH